MGKTNQVIKKNEGNAVNGKRKMPVIVLERPKIHEEYKSAGDGPVYVHYLPDKCSVIGADMYLRMSSCYPAEKQAVMETLKANAKLQKQSTRITKHPLKIENNMLVLDSLETGSMSIFEPDGSKVVYVEHSPDGCVTGGTNLIGEIKTEILLEKKAVLVTEIYCKDSYEELVKAMIDQVEFFVEYYEGFDKMEMSDSVLEKWDLYNA